LPGELETGFRINEAILRHLTVLVEGPLPIKKPGEPAEAAAEVAAPVAVDDGEEEEF
jgi:ribosomal protein S6